MQHRTQAAEDPLTTEGDGPSLKKKSCCQCPAWPTSLLTVDERYDEIYKQRQMLLSRVCSTLESRETACDRLVRTN